MAEPTGGRAGGGAGSGPRILVVGEALIDIVEPVDGSVREHVGGSPANVAVGLATLGHPTGLATHVADDERGRRITAHLQDRGVDLLPGSVSAARTPTATAHLDREGGAEYDFEMTWELAGIPLEGVGHVHSGSIAATLEPGASAVLELLSAARETATVSYDPNVRPALMGQPHEIRARVEECVGRADVVKASADDLAWLYADAPVREVVHLWGLLGPSVVVVTRSGDGSLVHLSATGEEHEEPAIPVEVVDTVGAGDSYMTGLLSGLADAGLVGGPEARERLRSTSLADALPAVRRAIACATYTVERAGAAAPTRSQLGLPG